MDYFEDKLSKRQKIVFELHLRVCRECRAYLAEYKSAIEKATEQGNVLYSQMDMGEVPEDLISAILEAQKK